MIALQDWLAPTFVLVLTESKLGWVYSRHRPSEGVLLHEGWHVWQALRDGTWTFRLRWLLSRVGRLNYESEAYAVQYEHVYGPDSSVSRVEKKLEEVARVYLLGDLDAQDFETIRSAVERVRGQTLQLEVIYE